jgi:hypothetical protein
MKKILFLLLISVSAFAQPYNGTIIRGVSFTTDANNSSTAQLASGAVFLGSITTVSTTSPQLQFTVSSDQPLTLQVIQYNDAAGTKILQTFPIEVPKSVGFKYNVNLEGNFYRVRVKNVGIATTTLLDISCTIGYMPVGSPGVGNVVNGSESAVPVRQTPSITFDPSFANVLASTWDATYWTQVIVGSGQAISQSAGNGVITTGTTVNAETILRSNQTFTGSFRLREETILSQRIANNNFYVELVDVIGDGLAITVNSATSVTVTIPSNTFTSANVGQFMFIGAATGFTGVTAVPGRYAIASVSGNNVTFTVAGWATGAGNTGTCSLFGWNYHNVLYQSTTATNTTYDTQENGWSLGSTLTAINTTASPGHMGILGADETTAFFADQLIATATTLPITLRASRVKKVPDRTKPLWLQIRAVNGTTAPASTTTFTTGVITVENYNNAPVAITSSNVNGQNTAIQVAGTVGVSGTVPVSIAAALVAGSNAIGDVGVQYRANATGAATNFHLVSAATTNATVVKASAGRIVGWQVTNTNAAFRYVKIHNQTTTPTAGSGVVQTIAVPPNSTVVLEVIGGVGRGTGIGITTTTGSADADATAVAAGDLIIDIFYQ